MLPALSGFVVGVAHVVSGPDHLAAVAPLAVGSRRALSAALVGASWGLGHGLGVVGVGVAGQLLKGTLDLGTLNSWAELLVAISLICIGAWTIHKSHRVTIHEHTHRHDGDEHTHLHVHDGRQHEHERSGHDHRHAALGIGITHGLAGSSHFYAVVPSLAMTGEQATMYLIGYLLAAVAAMAAFGAVVGWISRVAGPGHVTTAMRLAGWICLSVGAAWLAINIAP